MSELQNIRDININLARPISSLPALPKQGALVKVCYAGACIGDGNLGKRNTVPSLPGSEIAGVLQSLSKPLQNSNYHIGDKVIVYPETETCVANAGIRDFVAIDNAESLIQVPTNISLEVASMLPGAALTAYSAVQKIKEHVESKLKTAQCVNVLIVGAGSQGMWTLQVAAWLMKNYDTNRVHITIADAHIERLLAAREYRCYEIIHWNDEDHEQYIIERTQDACRGGGVDIALDYIGNQRTVSRVLSVLNKNGVLVFGGSNLSEVNIDLNSLVQKQQAIETVPKGTHAQLSELVTAVSTKNLTPPCYSVYDVCQAAQVFDDLIQSRIVGGAILKYGDMTTTTLDDVKNKINLNKNLNSPVTNMTADLRPSFYIDGNQSLDALCDNGNFMDITED